MNIAKLNTASLDDKTFIIKRGTSGGGSTPDTPPSGGESGDNYVYANLEQLGQIESIAFGMFAMLVKVEKDGEVQIVPAGYARILESNGGEWKEVGIDISVKVVMSGYGVMTIAETLVEVGVDINSIPKITKEQFYSLD